MTFKDLAWAAFIYQGLRNDKEYQEVMAETKFLDKLRKDPEGIPFSEFDSIVRLFLNQWRCRTSKLVGKRLLHFIQGNFKTLQKLEGFSILDASTEDIKKAGSIYGNIRKVKGVGPAIAGKFLHIINPRLFLPIDNPMLVYFSNHPEYNISDSAEGYSTFLFFGQKHARQSVVDFRNCCHTNSPETFLSQKLGYKKNKNLVKFIDEYLWVTITNRYSIPPRWSPADIK